MTNSEKVKEKVREMDADELIEFCGGDSCVNVLCSVVGDSSLCCHGGRKAEYSCAECIKRYLRQEAEG